MFAFILAQRKVNKQYSQVLWVTINYPLRGVILKKLVITLFTLFILSHSRVALANIDFDEEVYIKQHWISLTTSYDVETKTHKLGTIYRKFFSLLLAYEFFDPYDNKVAVAKSKFFSFNAHFDIYDHNDALLGSADEKLFAFFPTFVIYDKDGVTKLANAKMNFWGTTFYIYDPQTKLEIAQMYRPFFRVKNDWTFKVTDKKLFAQKNIDKRVLMTVIAFQGDREYWESQKTNNKHIRGNTVFNSENPNTMVKMLLNKIELLSNQQNLGTVSNVSPKTLEHIAYALEHAYAKQASSNTSNLSSKEQMVAFTDFCLQQVQSNMIDNSKKKIILYLLKLRLAGANS